MTGVSLARAITSALFKSVVAYTGAPLTPEALVAAVSMSVTVTVPALGFAVEMPVGSAALRMARQKP